MNSLRQKETRILNKRLFTYMDKKDFKRPQEYKFECWICGKFCNRKGALELHVDTHFKKGQQCRWCAAAFVKKETLDVHYKTCHSMVERDMAARAELIEKAKLDPDSRSRFFRIKQIETAYPVPERLTTVRHRSRKSMGLSAKPNKRLDKKEIEEVEKEKKKQKELEWKKKKESVTWKKKQNDMERKRNEQEIARQRRQKKRIREERKQIEQELKWTNKNKRQPTSVKTNLEIVDLTIEQKKMSREDLIRLRARKKMRERYVPANKLNGLELAKRRKKNRDSATRYRKKRKTQIDKIEARNRENNNLLHLLADAALGKVALTKEMPEHETYIIID